MKLKNQSEKAPIKYMKLAPGTRYSYEISGKLNAMN